MNHSFKRLKRKFNPRELILEFTDFIDSNKYCRNSSTLFNDVAVFCMFIGYPRSGSSFVGSLLDAHPNIIISHEVDVIKYLNLGFGRDRIFSLIMTNSKRHATSERVVGGYNNAVPGQWQGKFTKLICIGDKKAARTSERLGKNPSLIHNLRVTIGKEIKFIHVVRNPYDNISTISMRTGRPLAQVIDRYFMWVYYVCKIMKLLPESAFLTMRHESLIESPTKTLRILCSHLGMRKSTDYDYINACKKLIFEFPKKTRYQVHWSQYLIDRVERHICETNSDFFNHYSYYC